MRRAFPKRNGVPKTAYPKNPFITGNVEFDNRLQKQTHVNWWIRYPKLMADQNASSGNDLYEDYYISIYVPMTTGHTHGILVGSGAEMQDSGREHKANIVPKLYSSIVLGDLFAHEITKNSFSVESGDGDGTWGDNPEMTPANNVLKTQVTATIQIKNADAGA